MATLIVIQDIVWDGLVGRGGHTMCVLNWLRGLERLGHKVIFYDLVRSDIGTQRDATVRAFAAVIEEWWHPDQTALILESSGETLYGLSPAAIAQVAGEAAALITVGVTAKREPPAVLRGVRPRILIDHDPVYTQSWVTAGRDVWEIFGEHDLYFTVGGNVGTPRCTVPTFGIAWQPIWNPVVLEWWPANAPVRNDRFTTVSDWYSGGYVEFGGRTLGPKVEEFRRYLRLPALAGEELEIALTINPDDPDLCLLRDHGWNIVNPLTVRSAAQYREYVTASAGEFTCVKGGYAGTRCGWFSDRSACYLAAGRPVVMQATGFEDRLPTGQGLIAFQTIEEAADGLRRVRADYRRHAAAARELVCEFFDSDKVLRSMLRAAGVTS